MSDAVDPTHRHDIDNPAVLGYPFDLDRFQEDPESIINQLPCGCFSRVDGQSVLCHMHLAELNAHEPAFLDITVERVGFNDYVWDVVWPDGRAERLFVDALPELAGREVAALRAAARTQFAPNKDHQPRPARRNP